MMKVFGWLFLILGGLGIWPAFSMARATAYIEGGAGFWAPLSWTCVGLFGAGFQMILFGSVVGVLREILAIVRPEQAAASDERVEL